MIRRRNDRVAARIRRVSAGAKATPRARSRAAHARARGASAWRSGLRVRSDGAARARSATRRGPAPGRSRSGALRGIYTKLGQHLATRVDALSDEFRAPLDALGEAAPPGSVRDDPRRDRARARLERALRLDRPRAARAPRRSRRCTARGSRDGAHVAVKVRHPELTPERDRAATCATCAAWLPLLRPVAAAAATRASCSTRSGVALLREIDFELEGRVAEHDRAATSRPIRACVVPRVHWEATARSVLTLDYVPRVRLDDRAALAARGVAPEACLGDRRRRLRPPGLRRRAVPRRPARREPLRGRRAGPAARAVPRLRARRAALARGARGAPRSGCRRCSSATSTALLAGLVPAARGGARPRARRRAPRWPLRSTPAPRAPWARTPPGSRR